MAALQELVIGIPSNEIADKLEKEAPAQHYIGAEPILSISITTVRSAIQEIWANAHETRKSLSSSGSVVTHRSTNWARCRVSSFQPKRVTKYATPPTPEPWRRLVNDIDLHSPISQKNP